MIVSAGAGLQALVAAPRVYRAPSLAACSGQQDAAAVAGRSPSSTGTMPVPAFERTNTLQWGAVMLPTCTGRGAAQGPVVVECGSLLLPLPHLQARAPIVSAHHSWRHRCLAVQITPLMYRRQSRAAKALQGRDLERLAVPTNAFVISPIAALLGRHLSIACHVHIPAVAHGLLLQQRFHVAEGEQAAEVALIGSPGDEQGPLVPQLSPEFCQGAGADQGLHG